MYEPLFDYLLIAQQYNHNVITTADEEYNSRLIVQYKIWINCTVVLLVLIIVYRGGAIWDELREYFYAKKYKKRLNGSKDIAT